MPKHYDEAELCPREIDPRWWYSLPLVTRTRIMERTGLEPGGGGVLVGQVQEKLALEQHRQMASRFMRSMAEAAERFEAIDDATVADATSNISGPPGEERFPLWDHQRAALESVARMPDAPGA